MIEPIKGPQRAVAYGIKMINISTQIVTAVHTSLNSCSHEPQLLPDAAFFGAGRIPHLTRCGSIGIGALQLVGAMVKAAGQVIAKGKADDGYQFSRSKREITSLTRELSEL